VIQHRIHEWAKVQPGRPALVWNGRSLSYASFANAIEATRRRLAAAEPPTRGPAMLIGRNLLLSWINLIAVRSLGFDTISAFSPAEAKALDLRNPAWAILTSSGDGEDLLRQLFPAARVTVSLPEVDAEATRLAFSSIDDRSEVGGHILYTSGTTGTNKKVMLPGSHQRAVDARRARMRGWDRDAVYYAGNFTLWTAAGFLMPLGVWHAGGSVILEQPPTLLPVAQAGITGTFLIPPLLRALIEEIERGAIAARRGSYELLLAGSFVALDLVERALQLLTDNVVIAFGSTECQAIMAARFRSPEDLHWLVPNADRVIEVVDASGRRCGDGEEGDLRIRLEPGEGNAYLDDPEASARVFRDGFFYPGDLAVRRPDGRIRLIGRVADVINLQGFKVAVAPLEQAIQHAIGADEVCAFTGLTRKGRDEMVVAVQSATLVADQALADRVAGIVARFLPAVAPVEHLRVMTFAEFPRDEIGLRKTRRSALRKQIFDFIDNEP
jgi:acyl-coenzyme A synthetase/AMP-(fatty) acid ligase